MTAVGFQPTPFRNGALSHRLRPLGQTVMLFKKKVTSVSLPLSLTSHSRSSVSLFFIFLAPLFSAPYLSLPLFSVSLPLSLPPRSGLEGLASPLGMDAFAIDMNKDGATNMGKNKYDSSQLSSGDSLPLLFQSGPRGTLRKWSRPSTHRDNRIAARVHRVTPPRTISSKDASHC